MGRIAVVGSYIAALVMDTEQIPVEGQTVFGRNFHVTHGGKGSNVAIAAARLGAHVSFFGKIGRDDHGQKFRALLAKEGVSDDALLESSSASTATGIILFTRRGTNAIVIDHGANGEFTDAEVTARQDLLEPCSIVVSPLEIRLETARTAAELVKARGGRAILNPAPAQDLRTTDLSAFFALTPNETEARVCLGLPPDDQTPMEELGVRLLELGVSNVIITLGADGALWAHEGRLRHIPALPVEVVDTVGAGDAFNAGLAVGLSEELSMLEAICLGITTASLSTQARETIDSYPSRRQVDRSLAGVLRLAPSDVAA